MKQIEYIEEKKTIKNISINKLDSEQINNNRNVLNSRLEAKNNYKLNK